MLLTDELLTEDTATEERDEERLATLLTDELLLRVMATTEEVDVELTILLSEELDKSETLELERTSTVVLEETLSAVLLLAEDNDELSAKLEVVVAANERLEELVTLSELVNVALDVLSVDVNVSDELPLNVVNVPPSAASTITSP